jgi:hypothetical protein
VTRVFQLQHGDQSRKVYHFQFMDWPDFGMNAPFPSKSPFFFFLDELDFFLQIRKSRFCSRQIVTAFQAYHSLQKVF